MARAPLQQLRRRRIVVLPDLFIDAIAHLPPWRRTRARMDGVVRRGGGNLPVAPIEFKLGGNAANTAIALARLGARTSLVTKTSPLGHHLLQEAVRGTGLNIDEVRVGASGSATVALEFGRSNVMLSHRGPLASFGPDRLGRSAWRRLASADAVVVTNWAQNEKGTLLLSRLASRLGPRGIFLFVDTGDPTHRPRSDVRRLLAQRRTWAHVGALGVNENEVHAFTGARSGRPVDLAAQLSRRLGCRVDFHSRALALSIWEGEGVRVASEQSPARRSTGAGDAWNAGNIAGYLLSWSPRDRLRLAHRVATKYVTSRDGLPPTARDLGSLGR